MKANLLGFSFGVLFTAMWPWLGLLLSPFLLIIALVFRSVYLARCLAFLMGAVWVFGHWTFVEQQALTVEQGRQQWQLSGAVGRVSQQLGRTEFDFFPVGPFDKLTISCYACPWAIERGDDWRLALKLKPFSSFSNPMGFDYRKWMLVKGYAAQGVVDVKHSFNKKVKNDSHSLAKQIDNTLSASGSPVLRALLLGDKKSLSAKYKRFINGSGLGHLFVVSGLHVGIVALVVSLFLLWVQRFLLLLHWSYAPVISLGAGFLSAVFYAYLSGLNVPAIRACVLLFFTFLLLIKKRHTHMSSYLFLAFLFVVLINPLAFMAVGSWLSFSIVLALVCGLGVKKSWYGQLYSAQGLAFFSGAVVLLFFGMVVAPLGFILNLILIPLFSVFILPVAIVALLLALMGSEALLVFVEALLTKLLDVLLLVQEVIIWSPAMHDNNKALLIAAAIIFLMPKALSLRGLAVVICLAAFFVPVERPDEGAFRVTVLDVGQGSSALIETSTRSVLVDTGTRFLSGMTLADYVVLPFMRQRNVKKLDILHITHSDLDHSGGRELLAAKSAQVIDQESCGAFEWFWDGVKFERFKAAKFQLGNNGSCLLRISDARGRSMLMTGDIEREAEQILLSSLPQKLVAEILLVPHHGSKTSTTEDFLNMVDPKVAIISAGVMNHYGHPYEEVVQRLYSKSIKVYSTASHGAIQVDFDPRQEGLSVSTYRPILKYADNR
mgnify:FL=1